MIANNFITKLDHSPRSKNNEQSTTIDVTYNVLPKKSENDFIEPCILTRKRLRSRDGDDVSSPGKYFITTIHCPDPFTIFPFFIILFLSSKIFLIFIEFLSSFIMFDL